MQKQERKGEKNNARIKENKKKAKEAKNYTQALGELKCVYTKEKWFKIRMLLSKAVLDIRGILNFRAKGSTYFGPLKTKWKFPHICPAVGKQKELLLYIALHECTSQSSKNC